MGNVAKDVAPEVLDNIKHNIKLLHDQLNKTRDELYDAKDVAGITEKYWKKVEEAATTLSIRLRLSFPALI